MFLAAFLKVSQLQRQSNQLATIINTLAFLSSYSHQLPAFGRRNISGFNCLLAPRRTAQPSYRQNLYSKRTMSASARDHPVLSRLLNTNEQWSKDVEKAEPGFFQLQSKGQFPQASSMVARDVLTFTDWNV